jgi:outer membrane protein assembly factor BamE (lipoprotein component of BamABCDE complex)
MEKKLFILVLGILFFSGCATTTYSSGVKLDRSKVSQIQKGITTRAEVETLFGPPVIVSPMSNGRRTMFYNSVEASGAVTPETYIPVIGLFVHGYRGQTKIQRLQIVLNKADIVEDYEFTDSIGKTETRR